MSATTTVIHGGGSVGVAVAAAISWSVNKSILWAMLHGFLGWFYIIYFAITRES